MKYIYSDDELLEPIRSFYAENGRAPKFRETPHAHTVLERFGSLKAALEKCGIKQFAPFKHAPCARKDRILNGYRVVYRPDHFNCNLGKNYQGYVYEHRYIIESELGRPLQRDEVVHHLDMNKLNNERTNLILLSRGDHQRLHKWIKEAC